MYRETIAGVEFLPNDKVVSHLVTNDKIVSFVVTKHKVVYSSPE